MLKLDKCSSLSELARLEQQSRRIRSIVGVACIVSRLDRSKVWRTRTLSYRPKVNELTYEMPCTRDLLRLYLS